MARDAYGALDYLASLPDVDKDRIAVMGFSLGALAINSVLIPEQFRASGGLDFRAAIALYGGCWGIGYYSKASIPLMEIVGDKDINHAPSCEEAGKIFPIEVHVLPGIYHAFDSRAGRNTYDVAGNRMQYSASATRKARELTKAFLMAKFLGACCDRAPENATAGLDVNETAKKLIQEHGGMATLDAQLKAGDARARGDGKANAFWLDVREVAQRLLGE